MARSYGVTALTITLTVCGGTLSACGGGGDGDSDAAAELDLGEMVVAPVDTVDSTDDTSQAADESEVDNSVAPATPTPVSFTCRPVAESCGATDFFVENSEQLAQALDDSSGGEVIELGAGEYGKLVVEGREFSDYVTLCANPGDDALFTGIDIINSAYIRIRQVRVGHEGNGGLGSRIVGVQEGSHHVEIVGSEVHGLIDDDFSGHRLFAIEDSSDVLLQNNFGHHGLRGIFVASSQNVAVVGNQLEDLGDDDMKITSVDGILVENNIGARRKYPLPDAHIDFIQGQGGSSRNLVIRGNVTMPENDYSQQGIFLSDTTYHNVLIENNVVYNALIRGVNVDDGSTDVIIRYNTVLDVPDNTATKASAIFAPDGATSENNISANTLNNTGNRGSNVVVQHLDADADFYYDEFYVGALKGTGVTLEDLRPVAGSAAEQKGAFERIDALLAGATTCDDGS